MIRVCCRCKIVFGEKEPFEDKSETHGICGKCFPLEMKDIKEAMRKYREQKMGIHQQTE